MANRKNVKYRTPFDKYGFSSREALASKKNTQIQLLRPEPARLGQTRPWAELVEIAVFWDIFEIYRNPADTPVTS